MLIDQMTTLVTEMKTGIYNRPQSTLRFFFINTCTK